MSDATRAPAPGPARFGPIEAFQRGIQNYVNFEGRANRPEFWWWVLAVFVISIVASVIDAILGTAGIINLLVSLALLLPGLAVSVRRLHDTNRSGWWILIGLIPLIGWIILIVFYVQESDAGANDHGQPSTIGQR